MDRTRWLRQVMRPVMGIAIIVAALLPLILAAWPTKAFEIEFSGRGVKRQVLALYDSKQEGAPHLTRIHKLAEMSLNYLGYIVDYRDVNAPLPTGDALRPYRAVLSWFVEPMARPSHFR